MKSKYAPLYIVIGITIFSIVVGHPEPVPTLAMVVIAVLYVLAYTKGNFLNEENANYRYNKTIRKGN